MEKTMYGISEIMDYSNITSLNYGEKTEFIAYLVEIFSIIVIIVNFFVVFSIGILLRRGQEPRATFKFLLNISCADMLLGISKFFIMLFGHQFNSEFLCSFTTCLSCTASLTSIFGIALIAIDRYLYIGYGLHYHRYITPLRTNCMILSTWLLGTFFGSFPAFVWRSPMNNKICWLVILVPPKVALILPSLGIIPLIIILVLYSIILKNALNSRSRMDCSTVYSSNNPDGNLRIYRGQTEITSNCVNDNPRSKIRSFGLPCCRINTLEITPLFCEKKWKAVKIVVFTAGAYLVIWFSYFVIFTFYAFSEENCEKLSYALGVPMLFLSLTNSLLNPLIYAWWHPGFRKSVLKMYSMINIKVCRKKSPIPVRKIHQRCSIKQIGEEK
ncbi:5-hydroxytryptamine receptor 1A-like [Episyrphus balteatus]|uniref:5-hydroxytryptamine receptor 1A-like n=1 Tax=Episyrphus balteatus TaxID=286459 RepID=UPI0024867476|nr:5-hydroxytryptamine receptor 1A-like [Episyrphus balteatus]